MPKQTRQRQIVFPLGGINREGLYRQQPPYTTYDALNVMPKGQPEKRRRGGSRPGLALAYSDDLGSNIRMLTSVVIAPGITADVGLTLESLSPADDATGVDADSNLVLTFSKSVQAGSGDIVLYETSGDTVVETFDITGDRVTISSTTVTVDPTSSMSGYTAHYVKVDSGAIQDAIGNTYAIADKTSWNFVTEPTYDTLAYFGSFPAADENYRGLVTASNGYMYAIPHKANVVRKIDTSDDTISTFGSVSDNYAWIGGAEDGSGIIYCAPYNSDTIGKIDTSADSLAEVGSLSASTAKWCGAVYDSTSGYVYFIPHDYAKVLQVDPSDDSTAEVGTSYAGSNKWAHGILASNGYIYCAPWSHTQVLKIDPSDGTTSLIGTSYSGTHKWCGPVEASNGCIYCAPGTETTVLKIDTSDDSTSKIGTVAAGVDKFFTNGVLGDDGNIYWFPSDTTYVLCVNPGTDTVTTIGTIPSPPRSGSGKNWDGGAKNSDGVIYGINRFATQGIKLY